MATVVVDGKERSSNYDRHHNKILEAWFDENSEGPYPTLRQKKELANDTGLTLKQVNTWFTNTRKRLKTRRSGTVRRQYFSEDQINILRNWGLNNWKYPYPTPKEKERMADEAKLTYDQVQHWFINWRMRVWRRANRKERPASSETVQVTPVTTGLLRTRLSDFRPLA
ncbi:MAG: homeobox protein 4 [Hyperionvirus sp.]|uniref:Homeobox protein 4 n=1 Tax=Hyperionvirus sp. TaxID=2487770 RepID=A0A3G5A6I2_9VIRU|nr:MAG: homeobox protein 4 [Hyperionvirus sp.]